MKLTLRQARKIEAKIKAFLGAMVIQDVVRLRTNDTVTGMHKVMDGAKEEFFQHAVLKRLLINIQYDIRSMIGTANEESGINKTLTRIACLKDEITYVKYLSQRTVRGDDKEFEDAVKQKQAALIKGDRYGSEVVFGAHFLEPKDVRGYDDLLTELNRTLEKNQDAVSQLNFTYQITLTDKQFKPLQQCKLL